MVKATAGTYIFFELAGIGFMLVLTGLITWLGDSDSEGWRIIIFGGIALLLAVFFGKGQESARYVFALAIRDMFSRIAVFIFLFLMALRGA